MKPYQKTHESYSKFSDLVCRDLLEKFRESIKESLDNQKNMVLNEVMSKALPHWNSCEWSSYGAYPHYTSEDGNISINVLNGQIFRKGGEFRVIPTSVTSTDLFISMFGPDPRILAVEVRPGVFEFQSEKGDNFRVFSTGKNSWDIRYQKQLEGKWLELVPYDFT